MSSFSLVFDRIFRHSTGKDANIDRIRRETRVLSLVLVGISSLTGRALALLSRTRDMFTTRPDFPQPGAKACWPGFLPSVPDQREHNDLDSQVCCITFCKIEIVLGSLSGKMWMVDTYIRNHLISWQHVVLNKEKIILQNWLCLYFWKWGTFLSIILSGSFVKGSGWLILLISRWQKKVENSWICFTIEKLPGGCNHRSNIMKGSRK